MSEFIKKKLNEALINEIQGVKYAYGCVMLSLNVSKSEWDKVQALIDDEDIYVDEEDSTFARETNPHITILYGLHKETDDKDIKERVEKISPMEITLEKITIFEGEKNDVVKFEIKEPKLKEYNKSFKELEHTSSFPNYVPHATIAYVKKGEGKKYVQSLEKPIVVKCDQIEYSRANGTNKKYKLKDE